MHNCDSTVFRYSICNKRRSRLLFRLPFVYPRQSNITVGFVKDRIEMILTFVAPKGSSTRTGGIRKDASVSSYKDGSRRSNRRDWQRVRPYPMPTIREYCHIHYLDYVVSDWVFGNRNHVLKKGYFFRKTEHKCYISLRSSFRMIIIQDDITNINPRKRNNRDALPMTQSSVQGLWPSIPVPVKTVGIITRVISESIWFISICSSGFFFVIACISAG